MAESKTEIKADGLNIDAGRTAGLAQPAAAHRSEPSVRPAQKGPDKGGFYWGTGRRKSSVARVRLKPGEGKLLINKRRLEDYFTGHQDRKAVLSPLKTVEAEKSFDVFVNVRGGGTTGQAGATLLGIARALKAYDENYVPLLRDSGHLTRDSREVERKKPGQKGARKRFQFSKR
jgi:small subunit ribosomal protein S9